MEPPTSAEEAMGSMSSTMVVRRSVAGEARAGSAQSAGPPGSRRVRPTAVSRRASRPATPLACATSTLSTICRKRLGASASSAAAYGATSWKPKKMADECAKARAILR